MKIHEDNDTREVIKTIFVNEMAFDLFEQSKSNVNIGDHGQVAIHHLFALVGLVRGKNEYSSGYHEILFKIEHLHESGWIFFGIISKNTPIQASSHIAPTVYGWTGNNGVFLNGVKHLSFQCIQKCDMQNNDTFQLLIA
jgi:hypothetical protein